MYRKPRHATDSFQNGITSLDVYNDNLAFTLIELLTMYLQNRKFWKCMLLFNTICNFNHASITNFPRKPPHHFWEELLQKCLVPL